MASTYSDLKIELIGTGEQTGTWGSTTNTNLGTALEEAITGSADVSFSSADVTLTLTNTNGTQTARNLRLVCTGTSGGARNLILGSGCQIEKLYLIQNDLADTVTVKNTTGTGVAVPAGARTFVFNDGTNVVPATNASGFSGTLPIANGGTGATDAGNARTNLGLGTIATQNSNGVSITGGSITGITDLAIADGGTGASTAANARTNLGLGSLATLNTISNDNWSGTDLAVGNGGTGASDAGTARSNLDVPSRSGSGASGTWNISISGNAATATSATSATSATTATTATTATALTTAGGSAPSYSARAWCDFGGIGTPGLRKSGNLGGITDIGVGDYNIGFLTAMPSIYYATVGSGNYSSTNGAPIVIFSFRGTSSFRFKTYTTSNTLADFGEIFIVMVDT